MSCLKYTVQPIYEATEPVLMQPGLSQVVFLFLTKPGSHCALLRLIKHLLGTDVISSKLHTRWLTGPSFNQTPTQNLLTASWKRGGRSGKFGKFLLNLLPKIKFWTNTSRSCWNVLYFISITPGVISSSNENKFHLFYPALSIIMCSLWRNKINSVQPG